MSKKNGKYVYRNSNFCSNAYDIVLESALRMHPDLDDYEIWSDSDVVCVAQNAAGAHLIVAALNDGKVSGLRYCTKRHGPKGTWDIFAAQDTNKKGYYPDRAVIAACIQKSQAEKIIKVLNGDK